VVQKYRKWLGIGLELWHWTLFISYTVVSLHSVLNIFPSLASTAKLTGDSWNITVKRSEQSTLRLFFRVSDALPILLTL
jgi:hypothetical protein